MEKRVKQIAVFLGLLLVGALFVFFIEYPFFLNRIISKIEFSGFFLDLRNIIFVFGVVLAFILVFFTFRHIKKKKRNKTKKKDFNVKRKLRNKRSSTRIDVLYYKIEDRKKVNLSWISRNFGISKGMALEWSRMLEKENLVKITYPTFSTPVVKLKEDEDSSEKDNNRKSKSRNKKDKNSNKKTKTLKN